MVVKSLFSFSSRTVNNGVWDLVFQLIRSVRTNAIMMVLILNIVCVVDNDLWMVQAAAATTPQHHQQQQQQQQQQHRRRRIQQEQQPLSLEPLLTLNQYPSCSLPSSELNYIDGETVIEPCILYDIHPNAEEGGQGNTTTTTTESNINSTSTTTTTTIITVVGVFDSQCGVHRDGAVIAVEQFNHDNNGLGAKIGYYSNSYIKFRLIIGIAGNSRLQQQQTEEYATSHQHMLESLLVNQQPQYILGTCSFFANLEKELAGYYETIVLSQVGPYKFYTDVNTTNDHVFGIHIPSETYGIPAYQALKFSLRDLFLQNTNKNNALTGTDADSESDLLIPGEGSTTGGSGGSSDSSSSSSASTTWNDISESFVRSQQQLRIIHRDRSEFFYSTCQAIYDRAIQEGFTNTKQILYNPEDDHNNDGILNHADTEYLESLADEACPPVPLLVQSSSQQQQQQQQQRENNNDNSNNREIALWGCLMTDMETNTILNRIKRNGCRFQSIWLTGASANWGSSHPEVVPYIQSGAQWHKSMTYSDEYFNSGQDMLDYAAEQFGYTLHYGATGGYHAIYIMYQNIKSYFQTVDIPNVNYEFQTNYEQIRRELLSLTVPHSLYGPTTFDENRRNIGRGSAGMQWSLSQDGQLDNLLVSPVNQATATVIVPTPATQGCPVGQFVNETKIMFEDAPLASKCSLCPVDTYQPYGNTQDFSCHPCVDGSTTLGVSDYATRLPGRLPGGSSSGTNDGTGASICLALEENLVSSGLLIFGYVVMSIVLVLAVVFASWTIYHRNDPVVRIGQFEFLLLICLGSMLSSGSIIPLSIQVGADEDISLADKACMAVPWLYSTGWMLQYGSLSAKSYRMYRMMSASQGARRVTVTVLDMSKIVLGGLILTWAIVLPWSIVDPFTWARTELGLTIDQKLGLVIEESFGHCRSDHIWYWIGPLLAIQGVLIVVTNLLLYSIREVSDRYQESKYVGMASMYACEFLILGIPILIAVGDSTEATHIALCCIVALSDMGILLMIFVPKIKFQRQGLPEGLSVGASIIKKRASDMMMRSSFLQAGGSSGRLSFSPPDAARLRADYEMDVDSSPPNSSPPNSDNMGNMVQNIDKIANNSRPRSSALDSIVETEEHMLEEENPQQDANEEESSSPQKDRQQHHDEEGQASGFTIIGSSGEEKSPSSSTSVTMSGEVKMASTSSAS